MMKLCSSKKSWLQNGKIIHEEAFQLHDLTEIYRDKAYYIIDVVIGKLHKFYVFRIKYLNCR